MSEKPLSGKTCLVTGGAGGLGKVIATRFLEAGATVVICDINQERLKQASVELSEKGPMQAITADLASADAIQALFNEITSNFKKLDILINNAAIMDRFDPVGDLELDLWEKVMAINLTAPYLLSKLSVRNMLEQPEPSGCIINIVSIAGKAGWAAGAAYTASKHGLVGLTKNTAAFYGNKGIRCNALMIGAMDTNIVDAFRGGVNDEGKDIILNIVKAARAPSCDLDQVADLCLFLSAGKGGKVVNGACIAADNGWSGTLG
ncbi:dehydrogenase with different specificitie [Thermoascus aurantiacus ATCC 26904]